MGIIRIIFALAVLFDHANYSTKISMMLFGRDYYA